MGQLLDFGNELAEVFLVYLICLSKRLVLLALVSPSIIKSIKVYACELRWQVAVARSGRGPHS